MYFLGNKKKCANEINRVIDKYFLETSTYIEPFAGGLNIFSHLNKKFDKYYINDINADLYNLYLNIRDNGQFDVRLLELKKLHNRENYYRFREQYNQTREPALLFYLLHTCFRSFYRVGSKNNFNCPCWRNEFLWDCDELNSIRELLSLSQISNIDWKEFIDLSNNNSLFIMDPPYDGTLEYYGDSFGETKKLINFCSKNNSILFNFNSILDKSDFDVSGFSSIVKINGKTKFGADKPEASLKKDREIICVGEFK